MSMDSHSFSEFSEMEDEESSVASSSVLGFNVGKRKQQQGIWICC